MSKLLYISAMLFVLILITGCSSPTKGLTQAPDSSAIKPAQNAANETGQSAPSKEEKPVLTGFETPTEKSVKVNEGCFFEKIYKTYVKAGVTYYNLEFRDKNNTFGYNFTSKVDTSINIMKKADVGVCIHDKMWQFFYPNGTLWNFKSYLP